jgi:hypothetical protein
MLITMENTGHNLLLRFIESHHFSLFLCIAYLARYADNIGIHYYLCRKLHSFSYLEIEFFLPQICQIILTVPTESVALEEFLLEMCNRSTHSAVLVSDVLIVRRHIAWRTAVISVDISSTQPL